MKMSIEGEDNSENTDESLIPKIKTISEQDFKWHVAAAVESSIQAFLGSLDEPK